MKAYLEGATDERNSEKIEKTFKLFPPAPCCSRTPGVIKSLLYNGSRFQGHQKSKGNSYEVEVILQLVTASRHFVQHVDEQNSYLCGYLRIKGLTEEYPVLTTFFDGEIISRKYPFLTRKWDADEDVDRKHWSKFLSFLPYTKTFNTDAFNYDCLKTSDYVFMRWKEHFLIPDHTVPVAYIDPCRRPKSTSIRIPLKFSKLASRGVAELLRRAKIRTEVLMQQKLILLIRPLSVGLSIESNCDGCSSMAELLLDSHIRTWVFLPIVIITFLVGIIRHYIAVLLSSQKKVDLQQVQDSQAIIRARVLRENGKYIPRNSYLMRHHFFNDESNGYFKHKHRPPTQPNPMDPNMMTEMLKGNVTNVLPMLLLTNPWFSFTAKVPFPLTLRFKPMLQRGIELLYLDASWVSSASWYFLNVFGLRSIYALVLGENHAADQARLMEEQMSGAAAAMGQQDPKAAFKAEWEALEISQHQWALKNVEQTLLASSNVAVLNSAAQYEQQTADLYAQNR
ncbi:unnamed protein product [Notodromas monacha]|uniref:ER membrane protein complex subunit 3 n=1 Tax=Notodromas monacha TaxID=399045 RepID=A0A7R9GEQ4_9CRUS|nr:unnamed protein product [Notodromas monacha]CAG0918115.1 unnamed protein product [Notodromas monacha]